jgi:hypothetical protein
MARAAMSAQAEALAQVRREWVRAGRSLLAGGSRAPGIRTVPSASEGSGLSAAGVHSSCLYTPQREVRRPSKRKVFSRRRRLGLRKLFVESAKRLGERTSVLVAVGGVWSHGLFDDDVPRRRNEGRGLERS